MSKARLLAPWVGEEDRSANYHVVSRIVGQAFLLDSKGKEQFVRYMRMYEEFCGTMPGVNPLVAELGVNHKTVKAALRMLEDEGLLVNQGRGVQRCIALPDDHAPPALRASPDLVPVSTRDCPTGRRVRRALSAASTRCSGPPRPPP